MKARRANSLLLTAWSIGVAAPCVAVPGVVAPVTSAPDSVPIRIMTWNIHFGHEDLARQASAICASEADVVGLQEVDVHWSERSGFAHQAADLASACGVDFRFGPIYSLPPPEDGESRREFGVAVLTRRPILSWRNHLLTRLSTQEEDAAPTPMPGFLQVTVDVDGTPVDVFVTHLDHRPDPSVRTTQVAEMLAILGGAARPTILMGDLNAPPDRKELAPLFERLDDVWSASSGPGSTYPGDAPVRRIDYVFTAGPLRASAARVLETDASDHRPVVAELVLRVAAAAPGWSRRSPTTELQPPSAGKTRYGPQSLIPPAPP